MMKPNKQINSTISKSYEFLFSNINNSLNDELETTNIINDAILLLAFDFYSHSLKKEHDLIISYDKFSSKYKNIFFESKKTFISNYETISKVYNLFKNILVSNSFSFLIFEHILGEVLEKSINRKDTGTYYTPDDATKYIGWDAIIISILKKMPLSFQNKVIEKLDLNAVEEIIETPPAIERKIDTIIRLSNEEEINELSLIIQNIKIIDPTCGSGAFIVSAFNFLVYFYEKLSLSNCSKILDSLYGLDISKNAIKLCKMRLIINSISHDISLDYFDIEFDKHFIFADAFLGNDFKINGKKGFDWKDYGTKFDCVIGNPPYVESKEQKYSFYETFKCGNLYALTIERALNIVKKDGVVSFVVPLSFISTPRMKTAREYLQSRCSSIRYSTFADRPGCVFKGVHQRLTIFFGSVGTGDCSLFTSQYHFWYRDERDYLFNHISFIKNDFTTNEIMKVGNEKEVSILNKILSNTNSLLSLATKEETENKLWVSTRIGFWTKCFSKDIKSSETSIFYFKSSKDKVIFHSILNSSLFYLFWVLSSDCWHVTNRDLISFRLNQECFDKAKIDKLELLLNQLENDLNKNKKYIGSKQTEYEFKHKLSKPIIDRIDDVICPCFGLTKTETEYVKKYTLKYRMNTEGADENERN